MATPAIPLSLLEPTAEGVPPDPAARHASPSESWQALLRGGWIVVAHARAADRHTIVTARPRGSETRGVVTARDLRLALGRAHGATTKVLAFDLGMEYGATATALARTTRKLQLRSVAELVALFGPGTAAAPVEVAPGAPSRVPVPDGLTLRTVSRGRDYVIIAYPPPRWTLPGLLSAAEQRAVHHLIAGASQRAIADACGIAPRTVANQLASAYRKMHVRSSVELFVALRRASLPL